METERRTDSLIDSLEGRKTAIRDMARETKTEAEEMMATYLEGEEEALDGFEFLTMAEAGELGHWEIVRAMGNALSEPECARTRRLQQPAAHVTGASVALSGNRGRTTSDVRHGQTG